MAFIPFAFSRTLKHTLPRLLPQKEGDHPQQQMVEDIPSRRNSTLPSKGAYPQSALRLTAPSAEGASWQPFRKASPERGGARRRRAEGFVPPRRKGRGGSVSRRDHNPKTRKRAHLAWALTSAGKTKPIPSYSSGEGVWGRGASLREAASPPESPPTASLQEGARGRGLLFREAPSLA